MKTLILVAASVAALAALPAVAQAQDATSKAGAYANLGYGRVTTDTVDLNTLAGRAGYRVNDFLGVEGELGFGVGSDEFTEAGVTAKAKVKHHAAVYGVGFLPVGPNTDILARVGYGTTKLKVPALGASASDSEESWNYGIGAQHHFDGVNGVRVDWTRSDFDKNGGKADTFSIAYTRKF